MEEIKKILKENQENINIFEINVYSLKSNRKNSKYDNKTIKFYGNFSKLEEYEICEYLQIFKHLQYAENNIYNISFYNNNTIISDFRNIDFEKLSKIFIKIIKLINAQDIFLFEKK